uniref:Uncharacterized protein n=1 Tax=Opuntia streptacantha TaxID=393608 RepID=A0A7C9DXG1_OPUST
MNMISARGEALRNLNNSTNIFSLPFVTYMQGAIHIFSKAGEFPSKNLINSISCGTPYMSVIVTIFSRLNVQSEGHSFSQKYKVGVSRATTVFCKPYEKHNRPLIHKQNFQFSIR